jgi:hypothetical protein
LSSVLISFFFDFLGLIGCLSSLDFLSDLFVLGSESYVLSLFLALGFLTASTPSVLILVSSISFFSTFQTSSRLFIPWHHL